MFARFFFAHLHKSPGIYETRRAEVASVLADVVEIVVVDMWDYEPELHGDGEAGECLGCDVPGLAFSQCLSCGAPVEPADHSFHYMFGAWVAGPRPD